MSKFSRSVRKWRLPLLAAIVFSVVGVTISFGVANGSPPSNDNTGNPVGGNATTSVSAVPSSATTSLQAAALQLATANGDPAPSSMTAATTDRQTAVSIVTPSDSVMTDESVYVVVMTGNFVGNDAKVPSNTALPTGTTLAADFNTVTYQVEDWSLSSQPLADQLDQLGSVTTLSNS
jgi:hypothetical protein